MGSSCCSWLSRIVWYSFSYFFSFLVGTCSGEKASEEQHVRRGDDLGKHSLRCSNQVSGILMALIQLKVRGKQSRFALFLWKSTSACCRLCGSCGLGYTYSTLLLPHKSCCKWCINKWVWPCFNKLFFTKRAVVCPSLFYNVADMPYCFLVNGFNSVINSNYFHLSKIHSWLLSCWNESDL